jgi:hypothetical protein
MTTTRAYRLNRYQHNLTLLESRNRREINTILRDQQLAAADVVCAALMATFRTAPVEAWAQLAELTPDARLLQAIDMACYLRVERGIDIPWGCIRERWELKLAEIAAAKLAEAEALGQLELAKAAADNNDCYAAYIAAQPRVRAEAEVYFAARSEREGLERTPFPGDIPPEYEDYRNDGEAGHWVHTPDPLPFEPTPAERLSFLTPGRAAALVGDLVDAPRSLAESRRSLRDAAKALERIAATVEALLPCADEPGDAADQLFYASLPITDALHGMADLCRRALRAL